MKCAVGLCIAPQRVIARAAIYAVVHEVARPSAQGPLPVARNKLGALCFIIVRQTEAESYVANPNKDFELQQLLFDMWVLYDGKTSCAAISNV
jgi:hypothetical protein